MRVLLAAGGTGGHIFPAVALARALERRSVGSVLVGAAGGMEEAVAAREGLPFVGVRTGKLDRSRPDPRALLRAAAGLGDALRAVGRERPVAAAGFGGFASFPGAAAAVARGVPLVLHEANVKPGLVTRLLARPARRIALADAAALGVYPAPKGVVVGMPVREVRHDKAEAQGRLGLAPGGLTLLVMGGSQGSVALNRLLPPVLSTVLEGKGVQVLHQTGAGRLSEVAPRVAHLPWYRTVEFLDGPTAWSASDLAVTRAGSSTLADAAYHGVPLLMVPLPSAAEGHQLANARAVEARGAGLVVPQDALEREAAVAGPGSRGPLASGILACLDPARRADMRRKSFAASPAGAAERLADLVLNVAGHHAPPEGN